MDSREYFRPSKGKVLLFIIIAVIFWFFPIVSASVAAIPFINFSFPGLSLAVRLVFSYVFSCFIINNADSGKKLVSAVILVTAVFFLIPKVASFYTGDIGGTSNTYCDCYGFEWESSLCCHSSVTYCMGCCITNETTRRWSSQGFSPAYYCENPDVDAVFPCSDGSFRIVSKLAGAGFKIIKRDGSEIDCPVTAEPSEECMEALDKCSDTNVCS